MGFVKLDRIYTHHFNVFPGIILECLLFYLIHSSIPFAPVYHSEVANFAACQTHLPICWALSWGQVLLQYLHICFVGVLVCVVLLAVSLCTYFTTLILSNLFSSVILLITTEWALCALTLSAHVSTFSLVMVIFPIAFVSSLTICSVLERAMARQPNIRKISQSSLYS